MKNIDIEDNEYTPEELNFSENLDIDNEGDLEEDIPEDILEDLEEDNQENEKKLRKKEFYVKRI